MDSSRDESSSDDQETSTNKRIYHRHSVEQIQRLEAYFKECPHPDELQRRKLAEELNLTSKQVKFWFQNKRTQDKAKNERLDNESLKAENMRIMRENEIMQEALKNVVCPPCGGPRFGRDDRRQNVHHLRYENAMLKQKYNQASSILSSLGEPVNPDESLSHLHRPSPYTPSSSRHVPYGSSYTQPPQPFSPLQPQPQQTQQVQMLTQMEKMIASETANRAVQELLSLIKMEEPMWIKSSIDGRFVIDQDNYEKFYKRTSYFKNSTIRVESSKEMVVVPIDASILIDMFLDTEKWATLFPTIVNVAKTFQVLESMDQPTEQRHSNHLQLMYEQMHIVSPLVLPREFMILRKCQQVEDNTWVIADVSYNLPNVDFEFSTPNCSKRPSGLRIEALPNSRSRVTWVEHVEVNDKVKTHRLYRDLLCGGSGYGARRWTVTLERMCERMALSSVSAIPTTDFGGVVKTIEGRKSVMKLSERMVKIFSEILKMTKKTDFAQLSEINNSGVRISVRENRLAGQPPGLVICAGSSLSLPLPPLQVYNFLTNIEFRHQWDVLCHGNPPTEVARFVTGSDHKNCVTFLRPSTTSENGSEGNMFILQDAFTDSLGGMVVYAPLDLNTTCVAASGHVDSSTIPILPSGFILCRNGRPSVGTETTSRDYSTLLTVVFQILASGPTSYTTKQCIEHSSATIHTLISSTIQRIKATLNCNDASES